MSRKFIPNGDLDFALKAESFVSTLLKHPERFEVPRGEVEELDAAVKRYRAALNAARSGGGRSMAATREKEDRRAEAEQIMRRLGHLLRTNKKLDGSSKVILGIRERTARPKMTPCPQESPRLRFKRALHESGATPMHELTFGPAGSFHAGPKPEGAVRLELFVDLVGPDEPIPTHPGANHGGRAWYLRSFTRSPIVLAPPMPRVPMRVVYWGRWADSAGGVGPFSATAAGWIEGGTHGHLPGGLAMQFGEFGKPQQKMIDARPDLSAARDERYSVAVLTARIEMLSGPVVDALPEPRAPRQLEGPEDREAA